MACPYFVPIEKCVEGGWLHPARLPLGAGWNGHCAAPGHEGAQPAAQDMREFCNLGYAAACPRLPQTRSADAVRFSVARDLPQRVWLHFVCEAGHLPVDHGTLEYDVSAAAWTGRHPDARIQKMAECYLQSYLERRSSPVTSQSPAHE